MVRFTRAAMYIAVPANLILLVLAASDVSLPRPLILAGRTAVVTVLLLEVVAGARLVLAARRAGADWRTAFLSVKNLLPEKARRILSFDTKGLVSLGLLVARRRNGVPPGAVAVPYSGGQQSLQLAFLFAMAAETAGAELLLRGLGAPDGLRILILVVDVYSLLIVLAIVAACVTRPHVLSDDELRLRYGAFFDLRIPRDRISSVRPVRNFNENGKITVVDDRLSLAVASQTNVVVELAEPIVAVRPLGERALVRTIRFYADDPAPVIASFTDVPV
ncbi:hypothetical protein BZB76_0298 [Actinomadura pelletieri DSM 43383]|uniref:Uncharacterized protein n=1 Tax=Actinomadura pelletieri DSM 43383 TaxID=1120940 RepID=A0A495QXX1_9ACTN|nr:hypothetical protein [Actinomadura pelletieri]RKS78864.1 hypothetical protein BZB76_0298 [Actinomadura pelletieri DSM 43383]